MIGPHLFNHLWDRAKVEAAVAVDWLAEDNARLHSRVAELQARVALLESLVRALRDVNADLDGRLLEAVS